MHTFIGSGTKIGVYNNREYIANKRDQIIFGEPYNKNKYPGGCRSFDELTLDQIEKLDNLGILNLDECQNEAPSVGEMIDFLRSIDSTGWYVHGYCVCAERPDFRISFEGVGKKTSPTRDDMIQFVNTFRWADELQMDEEGLYCWYD